MIKYKMLNETNEDYLASDESNNDNSDVDLIESKQETEMEENGVKRWTREQKGIKKQSLAVLGMSIGSMLGATVLAYPSPAIPSLLSSESSIHVSLSHSAWIGEMYSLNRFFFGYSSFQGNNTDKDKTCLIFHHI